jgi:hypothetical protein
MEKAEVASLLEVQVSGGATVRDVEAAAVELGRSGAARDAVVDLVSLGVTKLAWRDSPLEDWHAAGRIGQSEIMRANAATTRLVRRVISTRLPDDWWRWDDCFGLRTGAMLLFTSMASELTSLARRLPDGRTLAELAPTRQQLGEYSRVVRDCRDRWFELTSHFGLRVVVVMLARRGLASCQRWWLHPSWPHLVDGFVTIGNTSTTGGLVGSGRVREALLAGPDTLTRAEAIACFRAGISGIVVNRAASRRKVERPRFLSLLEPEPLPRAGRVLVTGVGTGGSRERGAP